jgi:NADH-quinone oxidoreductase subunit F
MTIKQIYLTTLKRYLHNKMNEEDIRIVVERIIEDKGTTADKVIPILQAIQDEFNYLPEPALKLVCETTDITPSQITGISTFYSQFRHQPVGKHIVKVCVGTACHVKGALQVYDAFRRELKIFFNEDTDADGLFTVEKVACLGCCTIAPVVQIDDVTYGHVTTENIGEIIQDFKEKAENGEVKKNGEIHQSDSHQGEIRIGLGSCCVASGSSDVKEEMEKTLDKYKINVNVKHVGCVGVCNQVPMMEIHKPDEEATFYTKINADEVNQIIKRHFKPEKFTDKLKSNFNSFVENVILDSVPKTTKRFLAENPESPVSEFLKDQINIATEHHGVLKPADIEEYKKLGGFIALTKSIKQYSQDEVINEIENSGLRGRGGAGFHSFKKWRQVREAKTEKKFIICNGDEGDPGAFMDRMLLESYPFRIIEGMIIAGYATGAKEGIFYIRAEYPLAVTRINEAIEICREHKYIGENILGTNFSFNLKIFEGAGAFVCGEETALIASIEGKRGLPILRPPYPSEKGLFGAPTLINNTETFSLVSWIIRNGSDKFNAIGTDNSKGTKVFALAGKINRGGLIEVPMGITIRKIVEEIGGGIQDGKKFKAVQIGGPSGGCIPASMSDIPIDFNSLKDAGAMMGSGGLVVLDETDCMVDIARYFLTFTQDQSCGRCTFCRIGTTRMLEILNKICEGNGTHKDLDLLEKLAEQTTKGSMCQLGKTAPNPVLSTLKYFREEYEAHINGKCPTGKCQEIITYSITDDCIGCTKCAQRCPADAITHIPYEKHVIDTEKCIKCDICKQVCPVNAVITN